MTELVEELKLDDAKWLCTYCMEDNEHVAMHPGEDGVVPGQKCAHCVLVPCALLGLDGV